MSTNSQRSHSQESLLPMPVQAEPNRTSGMRLSIPTIFSGRHDATTTEYQKLSTMSEEELSPTTEVELTPMLEEVLAPLSEEGYEPRRATTPSTGTHTIYLCTPSTFSWVEVFLSAVWYARMFLLIAILCTTATLISSVVTLFLGMFAFLGLYAPYSTMDVFSMFKACAYGSVVVGPSVSALAFIHVVWRLARMTKEEREGTESDIDSWVVRPRDELEELPWAIGAAVLAGALAMAVGFLVKPGLLPVDGDFTIGHAVAVCVWGLLVPLTPTMFTATICTLWTCDPMAGVMCCK